MVESEGRIVERKVSLSEARLCDKPIVDRYIDSRSKAVDLSTRSTAYTVLDLQEKMLSANILYTYHMHVLDIYLCACI